MAQDKKAMGALAQPRRRTYPALFFEMTGTRKSRRTGPVNSVTVEKDLPPGEQLLACFRPFIEYLASSSLPPKTIRRLTDWEQVVDAWQLDSWEAYRDVVRLGRKTRLQERQRIALWSIFDRVRTD